MRSTVQDASLDRFLIESHAGLSEMEDRLLGDAPAGEGGAALPVFFSTIQDIRSRAALLGFGDVAALTRDGEALLSRLRTGSSPMGPGAVESLLDLVEELRRVLRSIEAGGVEKAF